MIGRGCGWNYGHGCFLLVRLSFRQGLWLWFVHIGWLGCTFGRGCGCGGGLIVAMALLEALRAQLWHCIGTAQEMDFVSHA